MKPRMQRIPARCSTFLLLALIVGCEDGAGEVRTPGNIAGEYVVTKVNGKPLPATLKDPISRSSETVVRFVYTLRENGIYSVSGETRHTPAGGKPKLSELSWDGTYKLRGPKGDSVLFFFESNTEDVIQRGVLEGRHMTVQFIEPEEAHPGMKFTLQRAD